MWVDGPNPRPRLLVQSVLGCECERRLSVCDCALGNSAPVDFNWSGLQPQIRQWKFEPFCRYFEEKPLSMSPFCVV